MVEPPSSKSDPEMREGALRARREESITYVHHRHHSCKSRPSRVSTTDTQPKCFNRLFDLSLRTIKDAFSAAYTAKYPIKPAETHAAILVPLCNLNGNPDL